MFKSHCTPSHTFVTADTILIAPTSPYKAMVFALNATVATPTTTAKYPSSVLNFNIKLMTPPMTVNRNSKTDAIGGIIILTISSNPLSGSAILSNRDRAFCCMVSTIVLQRPPSVCDCFSIIPWNFPPSPVACAIAAATWSNVISPLLISSCNSL